MITPDHITTYKAMIAAGVKQSDAVTKMQEDHGLSFNDACDLAWLSVGKKAPDLRDHRHRRSWERGHYNKSCGE